VKKKSQRSPVLTSPWKIGVLVALLLVVVGFGAGYYVVETYGVELQWLTGGLWNLEIDSYVFFKEVLPLIAGLFVLSMISYFAISSAVRRYRYYLDSGQDYRKMIQLAESVDDLTNPAQIAKLRNYPELQSVLRSYGDQIRGISEQLNEQQIQADSRSVDLEMEIDTLLQGEATQDSLVEDRWWTPLYRKIEEHVNSSRQTLSQLKIKVHDGKSALGQVALSTGRIVEQISGTENEYPEIMSAVNDLAGLAKQIGEDTDAAEEGKSHRSVMKAIVSEMENTLHKLEEGGKVLNEFSEENNGLALNIALMAAKGEAGEHELAQFAEKVRLTADRFNKLSKTFSSMAQSLLGTCYSLKEKLGFTHGRDSAGTGEIKRSISSLAKVIEQRSNQIRERFSYIGNEIKDVQELVNKSMRNLSDDEKPVETEPEEVESAERDDDFVIERSGQEEKDSSVEDELIVDHGSVWGQEKRIEDDLGSVEKPESDGFSVSEMEENLYPEDEAVVDSEAEETAEAAHEQMDEYAPEADRDSEPVAEYTEQEDDVSVSEEISEYGEGSEEKVYEISIDDEEEILSEAVEAAVEAAVEGSAPEGDASAEEDWLGKADKQWFKIDIDKDDGVVESGPETVAVRETDEVTVDGQAEDEGETAAASNAPDQPEISAEEEDPIYDLFDLGAVEYVVETMTKG
jgi:hypothetical protein